MSITILFAGVQNCLTTRHCLRFDGGKANSSILGLYLHYAILFSSSPLALGRDGVWEVLAREPEGRAVLERARDAAFAIVSGVSAVG